MLLSDEDCYHMAAVNGYNMINRYVVIGQQRRGDIVVTTMRLVSA